MQEMEEIYKEHFHTVYRYLLALTHNEDVAEELAQETFYQAVKSSGRFDGSCKVSTWLCAIAKNQLLAYRRKNPVTEEVAEDSAETPSPEDSVIAEAEKTLLLKKLHGLPEPMRELMYMRLYGELSFRQIGEILGRTENWARVTFYRGKEQLIREVRKNE